MSARQRPNVSVTFAEPDAAAAAASQDELALETRWAARPRLLAAAVGLVLIALACGAAGVSSKFLFLDDQLITNNPALRSWTGLVAIWGQPHHMPQPYPLSLTALLVQYQVFHEVATGYRTANLLLHAANVLLLWTLLRRLELPGAWLAAAMFAAHPVVVDAVDWVSQQGVLLCGVFYLSGLIAYFRFCGLDPNDSHENGRLLYLPAFLLFVLALLCHVSAIAWPLVVAIAIWWRRGRLTGRELLSLAPFLVIGATWWCAVAYFHWHQRNAHGPDFPGVLQRFQLVGIATWSYVLRALIPLRTSFAYARWDLSASNLWLYGPTITAVAALVSLFALRRKLGRAPFAAAIAYLAMLLPFLGITNSEWMRVAWVADHLQYLPLAVAMTAVAAILSRWWQWYRPAFAGALVAVMLALSTIRAAEYRDQTKLWAAVLHRNPDSMIALNSLGRHALEQRKAVTAMSYFLDALRVDPNDVAAHMNIADVYMQQGEWTKAMAEYHRILLLRPEDLDARFGLALALSGQGDDTAAMREYRAILERDPRNAQAYNNVGLLLASRGEFEQAVASYRMAIELDPRFVPARMNFSRLLFERGVANDDAKFLEEAANQLLAVIRIDPQNHVAYFNIGSELGTYGKVLESRGNVPLAQAHYAKAADRYRMAVRLKPDYADAWRNLGLVLAWQSRGQTREEALEYLSEALICFRRASQLNRDDEQAALGVRMAETDRARVQQLPPGARNVVPPRP